MLKQLTYVPVAEESVPFAAAAVICGFKESGYLEDEYFMTGEASVYTEKKRWKTGTHLFGRSLYNPDHCQAARGPVEIQRERSGRNPQFYGGYRY
jgi:hypothetical protein